MDTTNITETESRRGWSWLSKVIITLLLSFAIFCISIRYALPWNGRPASRRHVYQNDILHGADVPTDELGRIDCYPEAAYGMDLLTPSKCLDRGCVYMESPHPNVPWCFVPQTDFGFTVIEGPIETLLGERWLLRRKNTWAVYQENFENVTFDIEMREDNILRFKVGF